MYMYMPWHSIFTNISKNVKYFFPQLFKIKLPQGNICLKVHGFTPLRFTYGITLAEQVVCKFSWSDILLNVFIEAATFNGIEKLDMHEMHVYNCL